MKVVIINPPLLGHELRGTGVYTKNLVQGLKNYTKADVVFADINNLPAEADLYHFPYFDPFFLTLPLFRRHKTVVTVHDLIPLKFPENFPRGIKGEIKWQVQRFKLKSVQAIITDSEAAKKDILKYVGVKTDNIHPVYLAPDPIFWVKETKAEKDKIRNLYRLPEKFVLYVGDGNWNKNLPNIIRAALQVQTNLVIISNPFVERNDIAYNPWKDSLIEAQQAAHNNRLIHGLAHVPLDDLAVIYQLAGALLLPSYDEGFGLPVVEAFASGCPVITSNQGSLKEVADGAAYIVNPDKIQEIAQGIFNILTHKSLANELVKKGKAQAKKFSWKKTTLSTYHVYEDVLNTEGQDL